jgi:hypothetical protein
MAAFVTTPNEPLRGDVDLKGLLDACPWSQTIKGVFLESMVSRLGSRWDQVAQTLEAPPRAGRYLPFLDYPLRDYLRLMDAAAQRGFPGVSGREAHRLLSRSVFQTFLGTTAGRVTAPLLGTPLSALGHYVRVYTAMTKGSTLRCEALPAGGGGRLQFRGYRSTEEAAIGVPEGLMMGLGYLPTLRVETLGAGAVDVEVLWEAREVSPSR